MKPLHICLLTVALTIMFCAFSGFPQIMRLYGRGTSVGWEGAEFEELISQYFGGVTPLGTRQNHEVEI